MSEGQCGNCNHYHYGKQGRIDCIVDGEWHDSGDSCDDYKKRVTGKSLEARLREAHEVKRRKEAKELQQMRMKFDKRFWQASW